MLAPKAVLFDLDDTLAESFQPPTASMLELLRELLGKVPLAVLTAAGWPRIEHQFLEPLASSPHIDRFYIFPNSSAQCFTRKGNTWTEAYDLKLTEDERARIKQAITASADEIDIHHAVHKAVIVDREAQIAYAAVGLDAPADVKKAWDPDQSKRNLLKAAIERRVPDVEVRIGGSTTIDITKKDINKAYGVKWLSDHLNIPTSEMLFVGDALYSGGNDAVVIPTGIKTRSTSGPEETEKIIEEILSAF